MTSKYHFLESFSNFIKKSLERNQEERESKALDKELIDSFTDILSDIIDISDEYSYSSNYFSFKINDIEVVNDSVILNDKILEVINLLSPIRDRIKDINSEFKISIVFRKNLLKIGIFKNLEDVEIRPFYTGPR